MSNISDKYFDLLMIMATKAPTVFTDIVDGMAGGVDEKEYLTKEQKDAIKAKYVELKG